MSASRMRVGSCSMLECIAPNLIIYSKPWY
nr:MAG TPA: hypothetical protein [Caudoviricetes sp.]